MKRLLIILILTLSFQNWTKADDIRDFEIEGISIGDNALNFFSKDIIDSNTTFYPGNKEFFKSTIDQNNKQFNQVQMHIKIENGIYIIYAVAGIIHFHRNDPKKKCIDKRSLIMKDISATIINAKKSNEEKNIYKGDKTGKSYAVSIFFDFKDDQSEYIKIGCVFYGEEFYKESNWPNHLRLSLTSSKYHYWLGNVTY